MAIADLQAETDKAPWRTCAVCHALATIPPSEAKALNALLANKKMRYTELSDKLAKDTDTPLVIDADTLSRHARGRCQARQKLR